jgi:hypothetical protein
LDDLVAQDLQDASIRNCSAQIFDFEVRFGSTLASFSMFFQKTLKTSFSNGVLNDPLPPITVYMHPGLIKQFRVISSISYIFPIFSTTNMWDVIPNDEHLLWMA